jgi:protease I
MENTMSAAQTLAGKRIAVLAADGFEQAELETALAALKEAGAQAEIVALRPGRIRGVHVHQSADLLRVDTTVQRASASDYDGLLIPGGYISPDLLRQSAPARDFVRQIDGAGKPVALMSHAPVVFISAGLAKQRTLTSWPGVRDDLVNAGATWLNQQVVRDANCLTSRGPQDAAAFVQELVPFFAGAADTASTLRQAHSDPPQEEPSESPGQPLRWLSTPSLGAMLSLAILGVGVVAANRGLRKKQASDDPADAPVQAAIDPP